MSEIVIIPYKIVAKEDQRKYLISTSIFRMEGAYRNFDKYWNGLKRLLKEAYTPDCDWILFVDNSVMKYRPFKQWIDEQLIHNKNIYILQYFCQDFIKQYKDYHSGTFGSIVRFLPLTFDRFIPKGFDKIKGYDAVYITDVDLEPFQLTQKFIEEMFENNASIGFKSKICYKKPWIPDSVPFPAMAGTFCSSKRFPVGILTNFLKNLHVKFYEKYFLATIEADREKHFQRIKTNDDKFIYGMDELFLNLVLLNYYKLTMEKAYIQAFPFLPELHKFFPYFKDSTGFTSENYNDKYYIKGIDLLIKKEDIQNVNNFLKELTKYAIAKREISLEKFNECFNFSTNFFDYLSNNSIFSLKIVIPFQYFDNSDVMINILRDNFGWKKKAKKYDSGIFVYYSNDSSKVFKSCSNLIGIQTNGNTDEIYLSKSYDTLNESLLSNNAKNIYFILKKIYHFKKENIVYLKNTGLLNEHIEKIKKWADGEENKVFISPLDWSVFQFKNYFSPFFWNKDYSYWDYVDDSISRTDTNINFNIFFKAYLSIYNHIKEKSDPTFKQSSIKIEDYVELLCGGIKRFKFIKELFDYLVKQKIDILFLVGDISFQRSPKLFHQIMDVLIPSKKYKIMYSGPEVMYNKVFKLISEGYGSLCEAPKKDITEYILTNKKHKTIKNINNSKKYNKTVKKRIF